MKRLILTLDDSGKLTIECDKITAEEMATMVSKLMEQHIKMQPSYTKKVLMAKLFVSAIVLAYREDLDTDTVDKLTEKAFNALC